MEKTTYDKLKMLEATHQPHSQARKHLKVYYGWSKINKIQKREAIAVIFENESGAGCETKRSHKTLKKLLDVVYERSQTEKETEDARFSNRVFTCYYIFLDDKHVQGSVEEALRQNALADQNNVSEKERQRILEALRNRYLATHPEYREPTRQLSLNF